MIVVIYPPVIITRVGAQILLTSANPSCGVRPLDQIGRTGSHRGLCGSAGGLRLTEKSPAPGDHYRRFSLISVRVSEGRLTSRLCSLMGQWVAAHFERYWRLRVSTFSTCSFGT